MIDPVTGLEVVEDLLGDTKNPLRDVADALTLYRAYKAAHGATGGVSKILAAMDKDGVLVPAVQAVVDLAPVLLAMLKDPRQKAKAFALAASLG